MDLAPGCSLLSLKGFPSPHCHTWKKYTEAVHCTSRLLFCCQAASYNIPVCIKDSGALQRKGSLHTLCKESYSPRGKSWEQPPPGPVHHISQVSATAPIACHYIPFNKSHLLKTQLKKVFARWQGLIWGSFRKHPHLIDVLAAHKLLSSSVFFSRNSDRLLGSILHHGPGTP